MSPMIFGSSSLLSINFAHPMTTTWLCQWNLKSAGMKNSYGISSPIQPSGGWLFLFNLHQRHFGEAFRLYFPACPHVLRSLPGRHRCRDGVRTDLLPTERPLRPLLLTPDRTRGRLKGKVCEIREGVPAAVQGGNSTAKFWKVELYGRTVTVTTFLAPQSFRKKWREGKLRWVFSWICHGIFCVNTDSITWSSWKGTALWFGFAVGPSNLNVFPLSQFVRSIGLRNALCAATNMLTPRTQMIIYTYLYYIRIRFWQKRDPNGYSSLVPQGRCFQSEKYSTSGKR